MYVAGELRQSVVKRQIVSPATGAIVAEVAWASVQDAYDALESAKDAAQDWARIGVAGRIEWMHRLRAAVVGAQKELRIAVLSETGKTWEQTMEDYQLLVDSLEFYATAMDEVVEHDLHDIAGTHRHRLLREPIGVTVAFIAWNFPLLNLGYKLGPAMAAGCPIVIKPSSKTPIAAYVVGRLCQEIGLPTGVVNILSGDDVEIGDALSASTIPALVTLIGSTVTAQHVMRVGATSIKRFSLELGGNAPALVFADADLENAADIIAGLKFGNAGQICVTPNRVFVHENVAASLTNKLRDRAEALRVGTGVPGSVDMGPLIDARAAKRVFSLIEQARAAGAKLVTGGGIPLGAPTGAFLEPTILTGVDPSMDVFKQEIFGPVIAIRTFGDDDDVLEWANDTDAGLSSFVFTEDEGVIEECIRRLRFGEVQINGVKYGIELPHGGMKQSGVGHDCSVLALEDYLVHKRVSRPIAVVKEKIKA